MDHEGAVWKLPNRGRAIIGKAWPKLSHWGLSISLRMRNAARDQRYRQERAASSLRITPKTLDKSGMVDSAHFTWIALCEHTTTQIKSLYEWADLVLSVSITLCSTYSLSGLFLFFYLLHQRNSFHSEGVAGLLLVFSDHLSQLCFDFWELNKWK